MQLSKPQFVNINEFHEQLSNTYCRFLSPLQNKNICFALDSLNIKETDIVKEFIWKSRSQEEAIKRIIQFAHRYHYINYLNPWYKWIRDKINEFYTRYTGNKGYLKDTGDNYNNIFRLFMYLVIHTTVFQQENAGNELDYYIASQYSSKYDPEKGLRIRLTIPKFMYKDSVDIYYRFKNEGYPPNMIRRRVPLLFIPHNYITAEMHKRLTRFPDDKYAPYFDIALPVYQLRLPSLSTQETKRLERYIQSLELLMLRELLFGHIHRSFLLSIEHLRTYKVYQERCKESAWQSAQSSLT